MKKSGAEIIVRSLIAHGTDVVFGYPGGQVIDIYDELYKARKDIRHVTTSHEEGACHAADGYARATGKVGVVIATSGPGATNLVTGIATAFLDSAPLIAITGNVATSLMGKDSFQEVDIAGITMPITKYNYIVKDVKDLEKVLNDAFEIASSGRPGPVLIDVPKDVQTAKTEYFGKYKAVKRDYRRDRTEFSIAKELISESKRPCIYAGGGVISSNVATELLAFAEKIDAPVITSMMGLGAIDSRNGRFLGMAGMHGTYASNKVLRESDLLIAVGTRFSDRATGDKSDYSNKKKIIHVDIDPAEIGKNIDADYYIIGDIGCILRDMTGEIQGKDNKEWNDNIRKYVRDRRNDMSMEGKLTPEMILKALRQNMSDSEIITTDVGQHQMWTTMYFGVRYPRTFITSGGLGTMGFGLGAAIGASIGTGERSVLITSDGSFHMNMNEIATVASENIPVVIVVFNNNTLGMVRQWQKLFYDKRYSNTELRRKTDYVALAKAMGIEGYRANDAITLEECMNAAFSTKKPVLIECVIDEDELVLPMIPPRKNLDSVLTRHK